MDEVIRLPLIGDLAPEFKAKTTQGDVNFPGDYKGKWVILFRPSADFTPVCTTEFMTFATMQNEFREMNTRPSAFPLTVCLLIAWLRTIKEKNWKDMKDVEITFRSSKTSA